MGAFDGGGVCCCCCCTGLPWGVGPPAPPALLRLAAAIDELELILNIINTKNDHSNRNLPKYIENYL